MKFTIPMRQRTLAILTKPERFSVEEKRWLGGAPRELADAIGDTKTVAAIDQLVAGLPQASNV